MKQCPICKTTYTDESLSFCLQDGGSLIPASLTDKTTQQFPFLNEEPTKEIPAAKNAIRVEIPQNTAPSVKTSSYETNPIIQPQVVEKKGGNGLIIGLLVALLAFVILGSGAVIGWLLLKDRGTTEISANKTVTPTTTPSATNEKPKPSPSTTEKPKTPTPTATPLQTVNASATVNSPNDGFLALRTAPSSESGERIMQIPHGSTVKVMSCQKAAPGKKGRWCRVDFDGNVGWAYDQFLIY